MKSCLVFSICLFTNTIWAQTVAYLNGNWWLQKKFVKKDVYVQNGKFTFTKPASLDTVINLSGKYCIPPFGDAHTHNLDATYNLNEMASEYLKEGTLYVQVLGNYGSGAVQVRKVLQKENKLEVTYANALLTATYGHGFYPYEPLAMGIYSPADQIKYKDSIMKSRLAENNAYIFLDSVADVDAKWPLILKYKPDHLKICLLDAVDYDAKRKAEIPETYGLSPAVAKHIVEKAHAAGLRVFAHIETADDARLCAAIGIDALAHLPGYGWNGDNKDREKYCITKKDVALFKKKKLAVIPTMNLDYTGSYSADGKLTPNPTQRKNTLQYEKKILKALYKAAVPIGIGGDYYGKTAMVEADSLYTNKIFDVKQLLDIWCRQTPQLIFPGRKIGEVKEGFEASFLILKGNPLTDIGFLKLIEARIKNGQFLKL